jgi:hypothetical protein
VRRHSAWRHRSYSRATLSGAALTERGPPCRRVSMCGATTGGAAHSSAAPPWTARQKRVTLVKFFRQRFIIYICFTFRLFLS